MGRRKIEIEPITNDRRRCVTFAKRKNGLIKKATELSVLCDAQVAVMVFGANQKVIVYSSSPIESMMQKFNEYKGASEVYTNDDYFRDRAKLTLASGSLSQPHDHDGDDDGDSSRRCSATDASAASALAIASLPFAAATSGTSGLAMQTAQLLPTAMSQVQQATVYNGAMGTPGIYDAGQGQQAYQAAVNGQAALNLPSHHVVSASMPQQSQSMDQQQQQHIQVAASSFSQMAQQASEALNQVGQSAGQAAAAQLVGQDLGHSSNGLSFASQPIRQSVPQAVVAQAVVQPVAQPLPVAQTAASAVVADMTPTAEECTSDGMINKKARTEGLVPAF